MKEYYIYFIKINSYIRNRIVVLNLKYIYDDDLNKSIYGGVQRGILFINGMFKFNDIEFEYE